MPRIGRVGGSLENLGAQLFAPEPEPCLGRATWLPPRVRSFRELFLEPAIRGRGDGKRGEKNALTLEALRPPTPQ
jgi:hypothetical protein